MNEMNETTGQTGPRAGGGRFVQSTQLFQSFQPGETGETTGPAAETGDVWTDCQRCGNEIFGTGRTLCTACHNEATS